MVTATPPGTRRGGHLVVPALSVLMIALLAAGWLLAGHLVDGAPPLAVAAGRTAASFVVITVAALLYPRSRSEVRAATARRGTVALLAFLGFFAYYSGTLLGTGFIGASRVGLIVSLLPCITFVIGVAAFREPSTRRKVLGTVLAVAATLGYALADGSAAHRAGSAAGGGALVSGGLLALGGTFTYAVYGYVYRRRMADLSPVAALPAVTGAGTVMLGLTVVLFVPLGGVSPAEWGGIATLGAVLTAPVFLISHELILRKGPLFTSALGLVVPFLVRLGEWALGREAAPGPLVLLLLLLCAGGVWLTIGGAPARKSVLAKDLVMTADSPKPTLVLVYQRTSLPWVFEGAERAGIDLVLVPRPDEAVSEDRLPPAVVDVLRLDIEADRAGALEALRGRYEEKAFQGIVTLYDPAVPFVAEAAELLGLPGIGRDVALGAQDKRVMRERLAAAGLNVPGFVRLDDPADWEKAARLAFPVVVKPAHGFSSLGVTKADSAESLQGVVDEVWQTCVSKLGRVEGLVVEEYLDGPEFAVESLAHGGEVRVLTIGYKGDPQGPYFEEGVYRAPAALPEEVQEDIRREVVAAHRALGITDGPTHTELRLRGGVTPYLLEMGARIGGSGVSQYIASGVTGIDFAAQALRIATGTATESLGSGPLPEPVGAAANYIVPCGGSGRITAIHGLAELREDPRVDHVVQMLFPGDVVRPYPDFTGYPAFVLSRHADIAEAEEFHLFLEKSIRIDYEGQA